MEADGHKRMPLEFALEFFGTMLFVFGILSTNLAISIPFSLLASVVIFGDVTGGHFNPAVTIGVFTSLGNYGSNFLFMILIIIAQCLGGLAAIGAAWLGGFTDSGLAYDTVDGKFNPSAKILAPFNPIQGTPDQYGVTEPGSLDFTMDLQVCINEVVCSFMFISVILMVKGKHTAGDRKGIGAAMCVVLTLLCVIAGTNKFGACFNPAVGIALTSSQILYNGSQHYLYHYLYAYTLGPALGGLFAGLFHHIHAPAHEPVEENREFSHEQKETFLNNH